MRCRSDLGQKPHTLGGGPGLLLGGRRAGPGVNLQGIFLLAGFSVVQHTPMQAALQAGCAHFRYQKSAVGGHHPVIDCRSLGLDQAGKLERAGMPQYNGNEHLSSAQSLLGQEFAKLPCFGAGQIMTATTVKQNVHP